MMSMKLSVIVPAYNCEKLLPETVECLLSQTLKDIQIIIVDDGSTDSTGRVADSYAEKHSCIKVLHKENGGVSSARNCGIELAEGKYTSFLDADDLLEANALEEMYNALESTNSDVAICRLARFGFGGTEYNPNAESLAREKSIEPFDKRLLWNFLIGNKCFRTELLKRSGIKFPATRYSEDGAFFISFCCAVKPKITGVYTATQKYRRRAPDEGKSVTQTINLSLLTDFCTSLQLVYDAAQAALENDERREDYLQEILYKTYHTLQNEFYRLLWGADDESLAFICSECKKLRTEMTDSTLKRLEGSNRELGSPLPSRKSAAENPTVSVIVKAPEQKFLRSLYAQSMPLFEVIGVKNADGEFAEFENFKTGKVTPKGKIKLHFRGKKELDPRLLRVTVLLKEKFAFLPDLALKYVGILFLKLKK